MSAIRRRTVRLLAVLAVVGLPVAMAVPPAGATSHPVHRGVNRVTDWTSWDLCSVTFTDPELCTSANGVNGDKIYGKAYAHDNEELMNVEPDPQGTCTKADGEYTNYVQNGQNGQGPPCPFGNGSGLNTKLDGEEIVKMGNTSTGLCYQAFWNNGEPYVDQADCYNGARDNTGTEWVQVGPSSTLYYYNVNASSSTGDPTALALFAQNDPLTLVANPDVGGCYANGCPWMQGG